MRIGIVFPSIYASPTLFGDKIFAPRELATWLSDGLVDKGHEVTMFSTPDMETKAAVMGSTLDLVKQPFEYSKFRGLPEFQRELLKHEYPKHTFELDCLAAAFRAAGEGKVDVLHVYLDSSLFAGHYMEEARPFPTVYTLHDPLPPEESFEFIQLARFSRHHYISISDAFRRNPLKLNFVDTVYHGIPTREYIFNPAPSDGLFFMGRLTPEKGLEAAIAAARAADIQLTVSVNIPNAGETNSYYEQIRQDLEDPHIHVNSVIERMKRIELYRHAKGFLFPIAWEEPFGMVLIEAMSCGTPIIAYNRGSVPEIVRDGVTGFIIDPDDAERPGKGSWVIKKQGIDGLVEAIRRIGEIDRANCRRHVEEHFSVEKMVEGHVKVYEKILGR